MSLQQQLNVSQDTTFQGRVRMSAFRAADAVVAEDRQTLGYGEAKATKRHLLGVTVLSGNHTILVSFYSSVAAQIGDVDDQADLTDVQIDTAVDAVWDDIAGVTYEENQ